MPTHVVLLRGINVGGHNKVAMADLREIVASCGHSDVTTYIQSGNVVFTAGADTPVEQLATQVEDAIEQRLGLRPAVVVLTRDELAETVEANPYPAEPNPKFVHAVFRSSDPSPDDYSAVETALQRARAKGCRDEAAFVGRVLYLHTLDGMGRSELAAQLQSRGPTRTGTARNWATVTKLLGMLGTD
jgi:uncharacterized protein (DUF1697 family)